MASDSLKSLPLPSIDRPFGIELWPYFDKLYSSIMGYAPTDFQFVQNKTPMSTLKETATGLVSYYCIVFAGRELMKRRSAFKLNTLFMIHNLFLTIVSGALLALFAEQLVPTVWNNGMFYAICNRGGGWTKELVILYYLNYVIKYVELLDTVFLFLKKKPLTFLHTYHHGATALLCYTQLIGLTAVSWVPITINLLVHVVMYWYYFQSARGVRVWWKEWITRLQILQFMVDLVFVYYASYTYFTSTYFPWMPNSGKCAGEEFAAFAGMGILSSYLLLFISFYFATYKKTGKTGRPRRNTGKQAVIAMKDLEVPTVSAHEKANGNSKANGSSVSPRAGGSRSRKA